MVRQTWCVAYSKRSLREEYRMQAGQRAGSQQGGRGKYAACRERPGRGHAAKDGHNAALGRETGERHGGRAPCRPSQAVKKPMADGLFVLDLLCDGADKMWLCPLVFYCATGNGAHKLARISVFDVEVHSEQRRRSRRPGYPGYTTKRGSPHHRESKRATELILTHRDILMPVL